MQEMNELFDWWLPSMDEPFKTLTAKVTSLHLATIAEGIERQDQADLMIALGCPTAQGFLYARPMPADQLEELLVARSAPPLQAVI